MPDIEDYQKLKKAIQRVMNELGYGNIITFVLVVHDDRTEIKLLFNFEEAALLSATERAEKRVTDDAFNNLVSGFSVEDDIKNLGEWEL